MNNLLYVFNSATNRLCAWRARAGATCGRLTLAGWLLVTVGCANTSKMQSIGTAVFKSKTVTTGQLATGRHSSESVFNSDQPPTTELGENPSHHPQIELVGYQDDGFELLPATLDDPVQEAPMATESSTTPEQLPLPANLPPIVNAIETTPQQNSTPSMVTRSASPQVINLRGASFRQPARTATEIMLELKSENDRLRLQLASEKRSYANLTKRLKDQLKINQQLAGKVDRSRAEAVRLREMTSKLQVEVDVLVADKVKLKKDSEAALREIESSLDAVLLNSISRARQKPSSAN